MIERDSLATITEYADNAIPEASKKRTPLHTKKENKNNELDEKDFKIIKSLCKDCRQSAYDIGNRINLSPDAVIYRMKKLEDTGIIIKYTVKFNLNKLGYNSYCIGGNMKTFDDRNENRLREFVNSEQNIIGAVKTIGTWEFLLQLAVKIPGEFHAIMKNMKKIFSDSIKNYDVWIVYEENYFNPFPEGVCENKM